MKKNKVVGIDLGSSNTLIYLGSLDSVIFNEPTIITKSKENLEVQEIGYIANKMVGRTPYSLVTSNFIKNGLVTSVEEATQYLKSAFDSLKINKELRGSTLLFSTPDELNQVQQNALIDIAKNLQAKEIILEPISKLTALGTGISIYTPQATLLVNIGGGSTNIGVIASGELVIGKTIPIGSNNYDKEIVRFIRNKYHVRIGLKTAENLKIKIGNLNRNAENVAYEVKGQDLISGLPHKFIITSNELYQPLSKVANDLAFEILNIIEDLDPEITNDIAVNGCTLAGGGCLLQETKSFFSEKLNLPVSLATKPLITVVSGIKELINN